MTRIVNPDRLFNMSAAILPNVTDKKLSKKIQTLVADLRAADAPMYRLSMDLDYERITGEQWDAANDKVIVAYDALAVVVEHMAIA